MKVAAFKSIHSGTSLKHYLFTILDFLNSEGIETCLFDEQTEMPIDADIYWDAICADAGIPFDGIASADREWLERHPKKVCITVHSATVFAVPPWVYLNSLGGIYWAVKTRWQRRRFWRNFNAYHSLITVSDYAKYEITHFAGIPSRDIQVIHHGVNHDLFKPSVPDHTKSRPYLLHISSYQRVKNVDRLIAAYRAVQRENKPLLRLIVPNFTGEIHDPDIELITTNQDHTALLSQYQNAMAFVFPSLVESFGLPILEAMASGCPVITSNNSGCAEVAGEAALLVNPYDTNELKIALETIVDQPEVRSVLRQKGLDRAAEFSWHNSGQQHLQHFKAMPTQ